MQGGRLSVRGTVVTKGEVGLLQAFYTLAGGATRETQKLEHRQTRGLLILLYWSMGPTADVE